MRFFIAHEVPGRIRFDLGGRIPEHDAIALEELFAAVPAVTKTVAYPLAGSFAVSYEIPDGSNRRTNVIATKGQSDKSQAINALAAESRPGKSQAIQLRRTRGQIIEKMRCLSLADVHAWQPSDPIALAPRPRQLIN